MSTRPPRIAFGGEVMTVTDDLELQRLLREAHDEAAAVAGLPAEKLREALRMRRTALAGGRR